MDLKIFFLMQQTWDFFVIQGPFLNLKATELEVCMKDFLSSDKKHYFKDAEK